MSEPRVVLCIRYIGPANQVVTNEAVTVRKVGARGGGCVHVCTVDKIPLSWPPCVAAMVPAAACLARRVNRFAIDL